MSSSGNAVNIKVSGSESQVEKTVKCLIALGGYSTSDPRPNEMNSGYHQFVLLPDDKLDAWVGEE